ncbi:MAG: hypothetical protein FWC92_07450 [Defluviitaleaceae bacterium]|nr:hypothetical protein [Defluviitaleaceae bacterium]
MTAILKRLTRLERDNNGDVFHVLVHDGESFCLKSVRLSGCNPSPDHEATMKHLHYAVNSPAQNRYLEDFE